MPGTLYLVSTPIGNLEDITLRALRVLRDEVSFIACEDTRQTLKLLSHFSIHKKLVSYHEHNETARAAEIIQEIEEGASAALVSDAGTPLLSDPGFRVVQAAAERGIPVVPIPGASAALAALAASGLATDSFLFIGFLPSKSTARRRKLEEISRENTTLVLYESPHRILDTLADISETLGPERKIVLARELTKLHEEFLRGSAAEIKKLLEARPSIKGEITLVIGRAEGEPQTGDSVAMVRMREQEGLSRMEAIKSVAKQMGLPKREVYRAVEEQGNNRPDRSRGSEGTGR